ncbi:hypothetical protein; putative exported protein [Vibrio atlanticus]|uniref:Uncharacterized protein n=1 Tax=Vibrio atlanticus (strain LGP32) TaxID=575788 RepID=B7VLB0_VIBA3|nr:hypothetical protein; putative exported protein [Vibrio atlanticus]
MQPMSCIFIALTLSISISISIPMTSLQVNADKAYLLSFNTFQISFHISYTIIYKYNYQFINSYQLLPMNKFL